MYASAEKIWLKKLTISRNGPVKVQKEVGNEKTRTLTYCAKIVEKGDEKTTLHLFIQL